MSAPAVVVFYGVRFVLAEDELPALEARSDPRLVSARKHGLKHYWGNFGGTAERWCLFLGAKMVILGPEDQSTWEMSGGSLLNLIEETNARLRAASVDGVPSLYVEWQSE